jgi:DNA-binding MurR/RpiR family transcriptional regulator
LKKNYHRLALKPCERKRTSMESGFAETPLGRKLLILARQGTASNQRIARHFLSYPVQTAAWSIEELAAAIGVSNATMSRFARALDFASYADLRGCMAEALQAMLQPVEKLRSRFVGDDPAMAGVRAGMEASLAHSAAVAERYASDDLLTQTARSLLAARTVYVMGFGLSAHLAGLLSLGLQPFCPRLINVVEFGGTEVAAGRMMSIGEGDALVAIAFPRYAQAALQLTDFACTRKARTITITDLPSSPLATRADIALLANGGHPVLSSSLAAALLLIESLVTAAMLSDKDNVARAESLTEAIMAYLHHP